MATHDEQSTEIVRWYTRARRFPQLIGRTPDGTKIPGGPYTFTQVIVTGIFLVVAVKTVRWWGPFDLIGNVMTLALATVGVIWAVGRIPVGARNPLSAVQGFAQSLMAPGTGRVQGQPIRIRRPSRVHSIVVVHATPSGSDISEPDRLEQPSTAPTAEPISTPAPVEITPTAPQPTRSRPVPPQLTGVQKLLASTPSKTRKAA